MSTNIDPLDAHRRLIGVCLREGVPFWWQGPGTLLISGVGLPVVLDALQSAGERVLGLEGFELENATIRPRLDLIYDESVAARGGASAVAAEWGDDVWVDVTLASQSAEGRR